MKRTLIYALSVLMVCSYTSCTSEDVFEELEKQQTSEKPKTCKLVLNIDKPSYEDSDTRSATRSVSAWEEGDKIYLTFSTDSGNTFGDAVFTDGRHT